MPAPPAPPVPPTAVPAPDAGSVELVVDAVPCEELRRGGSGPMPRTLKRSLAVTQRCPYARDMRCGLVNTGAHSLTTHCLYKPKAPACLAPAGSARPVTDEVARGVLLQARMAALQSARLTEDAHTKRIDRWRRENRAMNDHLTERAIAASTVG